MLGWLRRRRSKRATLAALVEADAADLIHQFGDQAYYEARDRSRAERRGVISEPVRSPRHWSAVKARIADLTGKEVGFDTATRYLQGR